LRVHEGFKRGPGYLYVLNRRPFRIVKGSSSLILRASKALVPVEKIEIDAIVLDELVEEGKVEVTYV
jgi:hypothetical protein